MCYILFNLLIIIIRRRDIKLKRYCEKDCQSSSSASEKKANKLFMKQPEKKERRGDRPSQFEDVSGMEKRLMIEEPMGESKSARPEQIGIEVMKRELTDLQLLHGRIHECMYERKLEIEKKETEVI